MPLTARTFTTARKSFHLNLNVFSNHHSFHAASFSEVPQEHRSPHSAWETPDPGFWTKHGYALVRADELGLGQSPGILDTMSKSTSEAFFDVIEWAARQPWSSGKVGLLGISYYAGSQWRVAARQPQGLACIVPWEGMSDYYRDRCRHGGIYSNTFIKTWWNRQVCLFNLRANRLRALKTASKQLGLTLLLLRSSPISTVVREGPILIGVLIQSRETFPKQSWLKIDGIKRLITPLIVSWMTNIMLQKITT